MPWPAILTAAGARAAARNSLTSFVEKTQATRDAYQAGFGRGAAVTAPLHSGTFKEEWAKGSEASAKLPAPSVRGSLAENVGYYGSLAGAYALGATGGALAPVTRDILRGAGDAAYSDGPAKPATATKGDSTYGVTTRDDIRDAKREARTAAPGPIAPAPAPLALAVVTRHTYASRDDIGPNGPLPKPLTPSSPAAAPLLDFAPTSAEAAADRMQRNAIALQQSQAAANARAIEETRTAPKPSTPFYEAKGWGFDAMGNPLPKAPPPDPEVQAKADAQKAAAIAAAKEASERRRAENKARWEQSRAAAAAAAGLPAAPSVPSLPVAPVPTVAPAPLTGDSMSSLGLPQTQPLGTPQKPGGSNLMQKAVNFAKENPVAAAALGVGTVVLGATTAAAVADKVADARKKKAATKKRDDTSTRKKSSTRASKKSSTMASKKPAKGAKRPGIVRGPGLGSKEKDHSKKGKKLVQFKDKKTGKLVRFYRKV